MVPLPERASCCVSAVKSETSMKLSQALNSSIAIAFAFSSHRKDLTNPQV